MINFILGAISVAWLAFELGFNRGMKWSDDCHKGKNPPVGARLWW